MKIDIEVPQGLEDVTLHQYQRFLKIQESTNDDNVLGMKMIEIFCNVSPEIVKGLKVNDAYAIVEMLKNIMTQKSDLQRVIRVRGVRYGFIPNLDEMTFGEYVDLDTYLTSWDNMHKAMSVLYRPIERQEKDLYNIKEYEAKLDDNLLHMPMDAVMGSILFFYHLGNDLSQTMITYLTEKQENQLVQYINSELDGGGTPVYMGYLKGILDNLKISLN
mgnify:FL=1|tara:strand:- start:1204 stop:1854 length:651 start_codon:yes stop_codon:yes gene_type:complete